MIPTLTLIGATRVMALLIGVHTVLKSAEQLATRGRFEPDGVLNWDVSRLFAESGPASKVVVPLITYPRFRWVLGCRLLAGAAVGVTAAFGMPSPLGLLVVLFTDVCIVFRCQGGLSGDFQMATIVTFGVLLVTLAPQGSVLSRAAMAFVAAQAVLSYAIAGLSKAMSDEWRDGTAVLGVFATNNWGNGRVFRFLDRYPRLTQVGSWGVIAFECAFPLVLLRPIELSVGLLSLGVLFHVFNAAFMGLNGFLLAFPATYPAVLYVHQWFGGLVP
ncbi:hypothetical protein C5B91_10440 [Haloferax sp. Atlit-10N]|uniref:HTTM-like domain-containing protein n=2 Tax=Haloferacaceae TaxID=1644056 RepID=M0G6L6_HALPT|nr:hypothetical protein C457_14274 [Haloferax prahovense DSM 18310]RDZ44614.1 hypothetical protein C5B87_10530 [Haloferax sp. Atlit-16N]RDZ47967.1 hypothetical protein C5B86_02605 [Haloferax sp. Atlit-19N]RDZ59606.1 hypothetical protein C5B91_10440 [Haloferax sp. Atlit-10N]